MDLGCADFITVFFWKVKFCKRENYLYAFFHLLRKLTPSCIRQFYDFLWYLTYFIYCGTLRMTLLLGPPSSGKTTLLLALAGKLDRDLRVCSHFLLINQFTSIVSPHHHMSILFNHKVSFMLRCDQVSGRITYCGHELNEFVPQKTCAYISQHDIHYGKMMVRETLDFSGRCLGVGTRYEALVELSRREREAGIKPDPEIDAFMKVIALSGQKINLVTDYVLKVGVSLCLYFKVYEYYLYASILFTLNVL